jgi:choline dehydrogenase-like flavoprotein
MTPCRYAPTEPERELWDAVVIGTGMGGSTIGYALAAKGWRVLFIEKGKFLFEGPSRGDGRVPLTPDNRPEARLARGWWPHPLSSRTSFGAREFFAPLGCGSGGSTGLYAAQLERLFPCDLTPGERAERPSGANLPDAWPISYAELLPHYRRAEQLYRVCGTTDPLAPDAQIRLREPPPLSERDQEIFDSFRRAGLHPYRSHVGCEFTAGCEGCGGALCPRACKSDAGRICLLPALHDHGAKILADCEVLRLTADASQVRRVLCRTDGRDLEIRGKVIVLSAGALMSPVLLLNSRSPEWPDGLANRSGQVGRNLMLHASDFVAISPRRARSIEGPKKAIALNDFYASGDGRKLGTLQSMGVTVTAGTIAYYLRQRVSAVPGLLRRLADPWLRLIAHLAAVFFRRAAVFATIVEDLPYRENRVLPDPQAPSGMRFEYHYPRELRERTRELRKRLRRAIRGQHRVVNLSGKNNLNYGHACGTCRFGDDPETSVLDRNNRAHGISNLYVVDGSFFPSSGGTNPSLTIAANALRVAEVVHDQLRSGQTTGRRSTALATVYARRRSASSHTPRRLARRLKAARARRPGRALLRTRGGQRSTRT